MTLQDRKDVIREAMDQVWNEGNTEVVNQLYAPQARIHNPNFPVEGIEDFKDQVHELRSAHPDLRQDIHDVVVDGDTTVVRYTLTGTARGEFRELPSTGKSYAMGGVTIDKWQDGQIVEEWTLLDLVTALQDMEVIPQVLQSDHQAREESQRTRERQDQEQGQRQTQSSR